MLTNIYLLLLYLVKPTYILTVSYLYVNTLTHLKMAPQPNLLPDEQVICQADRVVTYSTG